MNNNLWDLQQVVLEGRQRPRLDRVTLSIEPGVTAIVGPSGAGKTSLLNILVGFESATSGVVRFCAQLDDRLQLFWVPQTDGLWPHLTVSQHLTVVSPIKLGHQSDIHHLLECFDLLNIDDSLPNRLSQGEKSRLSLARAVASCAGIIAMDEPMATVDEHRARKYWRALRQICGETTSLVFASHDIESVVREADYVICMSEGQILYQGNVIDLYHQPNTRELAEFLGPINWFTPTEACQWMKNAKSDTIYCRPEQVIAEVSNDSPLQVTRISSGPTLAEMTVMHANTKAERTMLYRPGNATFQIGERVLFRFMSMLILCLFLQGCNSQSSLGPELLVSRVRHWPIPPAGASIPAPRAVQIGHDGEVIVLDNAGRLLVFSVAGKLLRQWEMPEHDVGKPEGLCVLRDGRIAVADTHYSRIVFFNQQGQVLNTLGKYGKGPKEFVYPVAITQDDQENFYVCEYGENDRIQKFSVEGTFVCAFGGFGTGPGEFQRPSGIVWHRNRVYVADAINNRVQVFSDEGVFISVLGQASAQWQLEYPYDIAKGVDGDLYLIEYGGGRVTQLGYNGELRGRWGHTGSAKGQLATPWGLAVDDQGRVFIADTGNRRIVELQL